MKQQTALILRGNFRGRTAPVLSSTEYSAWLHVDIGLLNLPAGWYSIL